MMVAPSPKKQEETTTATMSVLVPFSIKMEILDRMLNFEITNDPVYSGLEIQGFDDEQHGHGMLVFLQRHDGNKTDVYYQAGLKLNPKLYALGRGLGAWTECSFETIRLDISETTGIDAEAVFTDIDGRRIQVQVRDTTPLSKRRMANGFLAPVGAAISNPQSLPLVYMTQFDLLRRTGPEPEIWIDGRSVSPGRLPAEKLLGRRLIKVAKDLCIVSLNPNKEEEDDHDDDIGAPKSLPVHAPGTIKSPKNGVEAITGALQGHKSTLHFNPAFPDITSLAGSDARGTWSIDIDDTTAPVVTGCWSTKRCQENTVEIVLDVTTGWRPKGLPPLMKFVTTVVSVFRHWPETYRWTATVTLNSDDNKSDASSPTIQARWERTSADRGEAYHAFSGANKNKQ